MSIELSKRSNYGFRTPFRGQGVKKHGGSFKAGIKPRGGLTALIPWGWGASKPKYSLARFTRRVFLFSGGLAHASMARPSENKNPPTSLREYFGFGGERGIRTPGSLLRNTRFPGVPVKPLLHLSRSL